MPLTLSTEQRPTAPPAPGKPKSPLPLHDWIDRAQRVLRQRTAALVAKKGSSPAPKQRPASNEWRYRLNSYGTGAPAAKVAAQPPSTMEKPAAAPPPKPQVDIPTLLFGVGKPQPAARTPAQSKAGPAPRKPLATRESLAKIQVRAAATLAALKTRARATRASCAGGLSKAQSRWAGRLTKAGTAYRKFSDSLAARLRATQKPRAPSRAEVHANLRKRVTAPLVTGRAPQPAARPIQAQIAAQPAAAAKPSVSETPEKPAKPAEPVKQPVRPSPMPKTEAPLLEAGPQTPLAAALHNAVDMGSLQTPAPKASPAPVMPKASAPSTSKASPTKEVRKPAEPKAVTSRAILAAAALKPKPKHRFRLFGGGRSLRADQTRAVQTRATQTKPPQARQETPAPKPASAPKFSLPKLSLPTRKKSSAAEKPRIQKKDKSDSAARMPLGLDIGTSGMRWAQLSLQDGVLKLLQLGREEFSVDASLSDDAKEAQRLSRVRGAIARLGLNGPAALSLPLDDSVRMRLVKMPQLPESEMQQALRWQVEQLLPPDTKFEDLIVDYTFVNGIGQTPESRVLIVTVPRKRVEALMACVQGTALYPVAVELDPFAVQSCLLWRHKLKPGETALVLHLGANSSYFSIIVGAEVAFCRSVLTSGRTLTQTVAENLQVPVEEAERLKQQHGLLSSPGMPQLPEDKRTPQALAVSQALASPMENLMVDIFHAFKGFAHQLTQSQIQRFDRIFVDGGGAKLPGLIPWLQVRIGTAVEPIRPFEGVPLPTAQGGDWENAAPHFSVAVGLAARDLLQSS